MSTQGPPPELPDAHDILVSTAASLVNLAGIRLTEAEHMNPTKAKDAIEAARQLLPLCPDEAVGPIRDALSQVQMLYVRQQQERGPAGGPGAPGADDQAQADAERAKADAEQAERAKARAKIWIPGSE